MVDVQTLGKQGHSYHATDYYMDFKFGYDGIWFVQNACK